ncbi:MAG: hypothetical protein AB7F79_10280 [Steroidobacteraceae bacterium]
MKPRMLALMMAIPLLVVSAAAFAHAPLLDCYVDADQVRCEAGYSDGTSAEGKKIMVLDASNKLLLQGVLDSSGAFTFTAPVGDYHVVFEGGESHVVTMYSAQIS